MNEIIDLATGKKKLGTITPVQPDGNPAIYLTGSIKVTSLDTTVFTVSNGTNEKYMTITATGPGVANGTVTLKTHLGKTLTKLFTVEIDAIEASDIKIEWKDL